MSEKNELVSALNAVLGAFADTIGQFEAAAEHARSYLSYAEYERDIELRRQMSRKLRRLVERLGGKPRLGGTFLGAIKRDIVHLLKGTLRSERILARLFHHEEVHLIGSVRLLADDSHLPITIRAELQDFLSELDQQPGYVETLQAKWQSGIYLTQ